MDLLVDIGNTRTKWIVFDGDRIVARDSQRNNADVEIPLPSPQAIQSAWVVCVGNDDVFDRVAATINKRCDVAAKRVLVTSKLLDIKNNYRSLDTLGADRWVAALGARSLLATGDVIIIDAGTAVTIDYLSREDSFEGGTILPGASMMHDALVGRTAGIVSDLTEPSSVIGKTTSECVNSGVLYGVAGGIERIVDEIQLQISGARSKTNSRVCEVLMCGGDGERLATLLPKHYRLEPDLIFHGLLSIARNNG